MKEIKELVRYSCNIEMDNQRGPWNLSGKKLSEEEINEIIKKRINLEIATLFAMMSHFYSDWKLEGDPPKVIFRDDLPMPPMSITIELETEFWDSEVKMTIREDG